MVNAILLSSQNGEQDIFWCRVGNLPNIGTDRNKGSHVCLLINRVGGRDQGTVGDEARCHARTLVRPRCNPCCLRPRDPACRLLDPAFLDGYDLRAEFQLSERRNPSTLQLHHTAQLHSVTLAGPHGDPVWRFGEWVHCCDYSTRLLGGGSILQEEHPYSNFGPDCPSSPKQAASDAGPIWHAELLLLIPRLRSQQHVSCCRAAFLVDAKYPQVPTLLAMTLGDSTVALNIWTLLRAHDICTRMASATKTWLCIWPALEELSGLSWALLVSKT
jgi:hypothetical protein